MACHSTILGSRYMRIKLFSLQMLLWLALAVVCPQDGLVELDLSSQLATRDFTSPLAMSPEADLVSSVLTVGLSHLSPAHDGACRSPDQEPPILKLKIHDPRVSHQLPHQVTGFDVAKAMVNQFPSFIQDFQKSSLKDIDIQTNSHQEQSSADTIQANTENVHARGHIDGIMNVSSLGMPPNSLYDQFLVGSKKPGENMHHSSGKLEALCFIASKKRSEFAKDSKQACKKFKDSFKATSYNPAKSISSSVDFRPLVNESIGDRTLENPLSSAAHPKTRTRVQNYNRSSLGDTHLTPTSSFQSWAVKTRRTLHPSSLERSQKLLQTRNIQININLLTGPTKLIMKPMEYWNTRAEALYKVAKTQTKRSRLTAFHSATERLGDLEIHKLGLREKMDDICYILEKKWVRTTVEPGKSQADMELQNRYRVNSVEYAAKTSLYLMSVVNNGFFPSVFCSAELLVKAQREAFEFIESFLLGLDLGDQSKAVKEIAGNITSLPSKRKKILWLIAAMCFQEKMPKAYKVIRIEGRCHLHRFYKMFLIDKTLLSGSKIRLFDQNPELEAISTINVKFILPQDEANFPSESLKTKKFSSLESYKRKRANISKKSEQATTQISDFNESEKQRILGEPESSKRLNKLENQNQVLTSFKGTHQSFEKEGSSRGILFPNEEFSEFTQNLREEKELVENLEYIPEHKIIYYSENKNIYPSETIEPSEIENGHLLHEYQAFRKLNFKCEEITSHERRRYIYLETNFLARLIIEALGLEEVEGRFCGRMDLLIKQTYTIKSGSLTVEVANKNRLQAILFGTRASVYYIKALNNIFSNNLFPTEKLLFEAQRNGFKDLIKFWKDIHENTDSCDASTLAKSAARNVSRADNSQITRDGLNLAIISLQYWIIKNLPSAFIRVLTFNKSIHRDVVWLLGDMTLADGYKLDVNNREIQNLQARFETNFILRRPF